jgi:phosphoribosylformylglycinamidine synthase subunit PurS
LPRARAGPRGCRIIAAARRAAQVDPKEQHAMKARIFVTLKGGVLDPQGKAIHHALEGLGFGGVNDVRAGKLIELDLADGTSDDDIDAMVRKLVANTGIENYRIEKVA